MLDFKEIKEKYPKSYKKLVNWTKETLLSFQRMIMGDLKQDNLPEITDEMGEKALDGFIKVNYRLLFDFFDKNGLPISIDFNPKQEEGYEFSFYLLSSGLDTGYKTRPEAEIAGFNKALEELEKQ